MKIVIFLILHSSDLKLKIPTALGLTSAIKNSYNQRYSYQFPTFDQVLRIFWLTTVLRLIRNKLRNANLKGKPF